MPAIRTPAAKCLRFGLPLRFGLRCERPQCQVASDVGRAMRTTKPPPSGNSKNTKYVCWGIFCYFRGMSSISCYRGTLDVGVLFLAYFGVWGVFFSVVGQWALKLWVSFCDESPELGLTWHSKWSAVMLGQGCLRAPFPRGPRDWKNSRFPFWIEIFKRPISDW